MPLLTYPKRLTCGVVIINPARELLLCHVTGHDHWDLPKGGIDAGETPLQAALRETREESGLKLDPAELIELGRFDYTAKKHLHLFAAWLPRIDLAELHCESRFVDRRSGRALPEMDGYGWFDFERVATLCTPKMAQVLAGRIDLPRLYERLAAPSDAAAVAA